LIVECAGVSSRGNAKCVEAGRADLSLVEYRAVVTTPIARAVGLKMEPSRTVTLTFVLPAVAEMTVDAGGGFGAVVSQTTTSLEFG
jgi:hypothetical protein